MEEFLFQRDNTLDEDEKLIQTEKAPKLCCQAGFYCLVWLEIAPGYWRSVVSSSQLRGQCGPGPPALLHTGLPPSQMTRV